MVIKWEQFGSEQLGACPPMPVWVRELGKDADGVLWLCEVRYKYNCNTPCFQVLFDTDDAEGTDEPFCRESVIYAEDYWAAVRAKYHAKYVRYENVQKVINDFVKAHGIIQN